MLTFICALVYPVAIFPGGTKEASWCNDEGNLVAVAPACHSLGNKCGVVSRSSRVFLITGVTPANPSGGIKH